MNVGSGDTKLSFDKSKPAERERAARIVQDMLRRGYAILVQVGKRKGKPLYQSATGFDPKTCEYIISGLPPEVELDIATATGLKAPEPKEKNLIKRGRVAKNRLDAHRTSAVAIARSAGG